MKLILSFFAILVCASTHAEDAKSSFQKTMAYGVRSWKFMDADVLVTSGQQRPTSFKCSSQNGVKLKGEFTKVEFTLGGLDCGKAEVPREVRLLGFIVSKWGFQVNHIPTADDPNQFQLWMVSPGGVGHPKLPDAKSLNALTRDNELFMDLVGEEPERGYMLGGRNTHYVEMHIRRGLNGQPDTLHAYYKTDKGYPEKGSTVVEFTVPLIPQK